MSISEVIKKMMKDSGLSQEKLAFRIGMTKNGLNLSLSNDDFKVSTLKKIAEVFNVPIQFFFDNEDQVNLPISNKTSLINNEKVGLQNNHFHSEKEIYLEKLLEEKEKLLQSKDELIALLRNQHKQ